MAGKLTIREVPRTDDGPPVGDGPVWRWTVDGLPAGERADIAESSGVWKILRLRGGVLENDRRDFPTPEAAFAALVEEYADRM